MKSTLKIHQIKTMKLEGKELEALLVPLSRLRKHTRFFMFQKVDAVASCIRTLIKHILATKGSGKINRKQKKKKQMTQTCELINIGKGSCRNEKIIKKRVRDKQKVRTEDVLLLYGKPY